MSKAMSNNPRKVGAYGSKLSKLVNCCVCFNKFIIRDLYNPRSPQCPLVLQCGHSACESCVVKGFHQEAAVVTCGDCQAVTANTNTVGGIDPLPHMYFLGHIAANGNRHDKTIGEIEYIEEKVECSSKERCVECSDNGEWQCRQCQSPYCADCWSTVHNCSKSLMKHEKLPLLSKNPAVNFSLGTCDKHQQDLLAVYCKNCDEVLCYHCLDYHRNAGHSNIQLKERNEQCVDEVRNEAKNAALMLQRLQQTLKKVRSLSHSGEDIRYDTLEKTVSSRFMHLHGLLQVAEQKVLRELNAGRQLQSLSLDLTAKELKASIEDVTKLLSEASAALHPELLSSVNLVSVLQKLRNTMNIPCHLMAPAAQPTYDPCVVFDDAKLKCLADTFVMVQQPSDDSKYTLRRTMDMPNEYEAEPLEGLFSPGSFGVRSPAVSEPDTSRGQHVLCEGNHYPVYLSHLNDPGDFYVTLSTDSTRLADIKSAVVKAVASGAPRPTSVNSGAVYLAQCEERSWWRVRVLSKDMLSLEVQRIDVGDCFTLNISDLRTAPPHLQSMPGLAHKCKVFDCVPVGGVWTEAATTEMSKMVASHLNTMHVMKVNGPHLEVDLSRSSHRDNTTGYDLSSLRDALVFLEQASQVHKPTAQPAAQPLLLGQNSYLRPVRLQLQQEFQVNVTYIDHPGHFYVQKVGIESEYLVNLLKDLCDEYGNNAQRGIICNPTRGMPCAVQFTKDRKWYRGQVLSLPGQKMVQVRYVDYGDVETVPSTYIRVLYSRFFKLAPQAVKCCLAEVIPSTRSWWTPLAKMLFKESVLNRKLILYALSVDSKGSKVLLYEPLPTGLSLINARMVQSGHAFATGPNVATVEYIRSEVPDLPPTKASARSKFQRNAGGEQSDSRTLLTGNVNHRRRKPFRKRPVDAEENGLLEVDAPKEIARENKQVEEDEEDDEMVKSMKQVRVLAVVSPALLYLFTDLALDETFEASLQEWYKNSLSDPIPIQWKVGDNGVVRSAVQDSWCRAVVTAVNQELAEVVLRDHGTKEMVHVQQIKVEDARFTEVPAAAIRCHMIGCKPASESWPGLSCEFLSSEVNNYPRIYLNQAGEPEKGSLPIELWVKKVTPGGALEPPVSQWVTLSQLLVDRGLAIPVKTMRTPAAVTRPTLSTQPRAVSDTSDSDLECHSGFIPTTVTAWIPVKPLRRSASHTVVPTNVTKDAVICAYEEDDGDTLNMIRNAFKSLYDGTKPAPHDQYWNAEQVCVARYHHDKNWYRGKVLKINADTTYDVLFVDYGNVESCQVADMRKNIKFGDIPIMSHTFTLHGIKPVSKDGQWPTKAVEDLHKCVVDKSCTIQIMGESLAEPIPVQLTTHPRNLNAADLMVEFQHAVFDMDLVDTDPYTVSSESLSEQEKKIDWNELIDQDRLISDSTLSVDASLSDSVGLWKELVVPKEVALLPVEFNSVKGPTQFLATLIADDNLHPVLTKLVSDFGNLTDELQAKVSRQPMLLDIKPGMPCCCPYSKDHKWYRAKVLKVGSEIHTGSVFVEFLDYGNREYVAENCVLECRPEWLLVPVMMLRLKLHNVELGPTASREVCIKELTSCLSNDLYAHIVQRFKNHMEVTVLGPDGTLAYQSLLNKGLLVQRD